MMKTAFFAGAPLALLVALAVGSPASLASGKGHTPGLPALDKDKIEKVFDAKPVYSPYANRNFPIRPLFGDTRLHTAYCMDTSVSGARMMVGVMINENPGETG
jgi:hypothetical protein